MVLPPPFICDKRMQVGWDNAFFLQLLVEGRPTESQAKSTQLQGLSLDLPQFLAKFLFAGRCRRPPPRA